MRAHPLARRLDDAPGYRYGDIVARCRLRNGVRHLTTGGRTYELDGKPSVSVVVPTRDRPRLLERAVASILTQRYCGEIECLVVFDQSAPFRPAIDIPPGCTLQVMVNDRTPGQAGARNAGALAARGDLLAFCDDDDEWLPHKLDVQAQLLSSDSDRVAVSCGVYVVYQNSRSKRATRQHLVTSMDLARSRVMEVNMSTLMLPRESFVSAIGLFDEAIPGSYAEDFEWLLRATKHGPVSVAADPLAQIHWNRRARPPDTWRTIIAALEYVLRKHPDIANDRRGLSRIYGQIAFAHAALGQATESRQWAARSLAGYVLQPRAYAALLVSAGLASPSVLMHLANKVGRGLV